jgi:hypothetical protein
MTLNSEMETTDYTDYTDFEWLVVGGDSNSMDGSRPVSIFFEISKICEICGSAFSRLGQEKRALT